MIDLIRDVIYREDNDVALKLYYSLDRAGMLDDNPSKQMLHKHLSKTLPDWLIDGYFGSPSCEGFHYKNVELYVPEGDFDPWDLTKSVNIARLLFDRHLSYISRVKLCPVSLFFCMRNMHDAKRSDASAPIHIYPKGYISIGVEPYHEPFCFVRSLDYDLVNRHFKTFSGLDWYYMPHGIYVPAVRGFAHALGVPEFFEHCIGKDETGKEILLFPEEVGE